MRPEAFHDLARRLARQQSEAARRTAVSRAYYGAFLYLRDLFSQDVVPPPGARIHGWVQAALRSSDPEAALALQTLRQLRNASDYDIATPLAPDGVDEALEIAADLFSRFTRR